MFIGKLVFSQWSKLMLILVLKMFSENMFTNVYHSESANYRYNFFMLTCYTYLLFSELAYDLNVSLNNICEGICQTLKVRVDKILNTANNAAVIYSVTNLIRYYKKCICKVIMRLQLIN